MERVRHRRGGNTFCIFSRESCYFRQDSGHYQDVHLRSWASIPFPTEDLKKNIQEVNLFTQNKILSLTTLHLDELLEDSEHVILRILPSVAKAFRTNLRDGDNSRTKHLKSLYEVLKTNL